MGVANAFRETAKRMTYIKWLFKQTKPLHKNRRLWWIGSSKIPTFVAFNKTVWKRVWLAIYAIQIVEKSAKNVMWFDFILTGPISVKHSIVQNNVVKTFWKEHTFLCTNISKNYFQYTMVFLVPIVVMGHSPLFFHPWSYGMSHKKRPPALVAHSLGFYSYYVVHLDG